MATQPDTASREAQKRQVARIVCLSDLISGEYVQQSGWLPNFVRTTTGIEASRVNIIGILTEMSPAEITPHVAIEQFSATLDDGSAKMQLRSFEPVLFADQIQIGIPVLVIARPKKYSGELFLVPEIIRKLPDKKWLEVRKTVLDGSKSLSVKSTTVNAPKEQVITKPVRLEVEEQQAPPTVTKKQTPVTATIADDEPLDGADDIVHPEKPAENVLDIINRLDSGDGVLVDIAVSEIKKVRPEIDGQQRILSLLLSGDVFEIRPGKIKVLK